MHFLPKPIPQSVRRVTVGVDRRQTKAHLHVHTLMEGVFRDVLGQPEVIEAIKKANQDSEPYRRAWEIVDAKGTRS